MTKVHSKEEMDKFSANQGVERRSLDILLVEDNESDAKITQFESIIEEFNFYWSFLSQLPVKSKKEV